jgi:hypothetical protein
VIETFGTQKELWAATFDLFGQMDRVPGVREQLADGLQGGRLFLAELLQDADPAADERTAWLVGSLYQALLSGLAVQWLVDPDRAPSGRDLAEALRTIADDLSASRGGPPGTRSG